MSLENLGWNDSRNQEFHIYAERGLTPLRITVQHRDRYEAIGENGARWAEVTGKFRHTALTPLEFPSVGDWVAAKVDGDNLAMIEAVLTRQSFFARKAAGTSGLPQAVAANIDTLFLVNGLDSDFNPRRIERYLTLAWESGAWPVIVLNKADLCDDLDDKLAELQAVALGVSTISISALDKNGLDQLDPWLTPGKTVALLGSSGVGKSTIINCLLGEERIKTREVKSWDGRGRHTTTVRELLQLPNGAVVIDTPGMKEIQLWADEESVGETYADIGRLASSCRFTDCTHKAEPGCAVQAALKSGALSSERFAGYLKQQKEVAYQQRKTDVQAMLNEKARWKKIHMLAKQIKKNRDQFRSA